MSESPILTVSQLTQAIKISLEGTFPIVTLQGEVSNFKQQSSGHLYFCLKDSQAQISAVMFRGDAQGLKTVPKDGDQVIVKGSINVYPARGNYQIVIRELTFAGLGELLLILEERKRRLHKLGYFSQTRKKPIPKFPRTIGVVTSPSGAVIQDILNILTRRHAGFHLILNPVKVQGEGAAQEIARAIDQFNEHNLVDVMLVGRGGGSIEDLWAFNEEVVAEAIYRSKIPIICAVGHETDHCIAEYVADVRAPTPSAAAELVTSELVNRQQFLNQTGLRIRQTLVHLISHDRRRLQGILRQPLLASPYALLGPWLQKLDDLRADIDQAMLRRLQHSRMDLQAAQRQALALKPTSQIAHYQHKLAHWQKGLDAAIVRHLATARQTIQDSHHHLNDRWRTQQEYRRRLFVPQLLHRKLNLQWQRIRDHHIERLTALSLTLQSIDPKNLLRKGYTIVFSEKGHSVISSVESLRRQQEVKMLFADGEAKATVTDIVVSSD